jgi:hypothetical protein
MLGREHFPPEKQRLNRLTFVHTMVNLFPSIKKRIGYTDHTLELSDDISAPRWPLPMSANRSFLRITDSRLQIKKLMNHNCSIIPQLLGGIS